MTAEDYTKYTGAAIDAGTLEALNGVRDYFPGMGDGDFLALWSKLGGELGGMYADLASARRVAADNKRQLDQAKADARRLSADYATETGKLLEKNRRLAEEFDELAGRSSRTIGEQADKIERLAALLIDNLYSDEVAEIVGRAMVVRLKAGGNALFDRDDLEYIKNNIKD